MTSRTLTITFDPLGNVGGVESRAVGHIRELIERNGLDAIKWRLPAV